MRFNCANCQKELNIPDEKLPATPRFKVKCPHCQERVVLDKNESLDQAYKVMPPAEASGKLPEHEVPEHGHPQLEPEIFPPGARILFMTLKSKRWIEEAQNFFQEMGYYESYAQDAREAVMKLRLNEYHVLLVEDSEDNQPVLDEIAMWPGIRRQLLNVVLIGQQAQSLDPQIAFRKGVNTYLNIHDIERGHELFGLVLKSYNDYYRFLRLAQGEEQGSE